MKIRTKSFINGSIHKTAILIIVLIAVVYGHSLNNKFAGDDFLHIVDNDFVKSWKNFPLVFHRDYLTPDSQLQYLGKHYIGSGELSYRPVVTISYFIDYSLWKLNPFGYHLTNVLLHICNVLLLYFLIEIILKNKKIALLTSLLFALHPINAEPVNAISYREDLFVFLFFISSLILFIKRDNYEGRKKTWCNIASIISFLLALFSKEMAITLPAILIIYDYYFVFRRKLRDFFIHFKSRYLGYIVAVLLYLWVWAGPMGNLGEAIKECWGGNFYTNILTMSKVVATYITWLIVPNYIHVTFFDSSFAVYSFFSSEVLLSVSVIILCVAVAAITLRKSKEISFAIVWFLITLLPVSHIVPIPIIVASRYLYIPAVGFCFLVAVLLYNLPASKLFPIPPHILQKVRNCVIVVLLIFYSMITVIKSFMWRNNTAFWLGVVQRYPSSDVVHIKLGKLFEKSELLDKAIHEYKIVLNLNPDNTNIREALGVCYYKKGMLDEAIDEFKKTLAIDKNLLTTYSNLGMAFGDKRLFKESIDCFKEAIRINPSDIRAYNNLGITYAKMKKWNEAEKIWKEALEINPSYEDAQENLKKLEQIDF